MNKYRETRREIETGRDEGGRASLRRIGVYCLQCPNDAPTKTEFQWSVDNFDARD